MKKKAIYRNHPVYYSTAGNGSPVVLLHGFAEDGTIWDQQVASLQKRFFVIVPDLPGSGDSTEWKDLSMEGLAEAVKEILAAENVSLVTVIGHSMGGYVALAFAEKYPELIKALGLFHSTSYADSEEKISNRKKSIAFLREHGTYAFLKQTSLNLFCNDFRNAHPEKVNRLIEQYRGFSPETLIAYYEAMMERPDRSEILRVLTRPVLFIAGAGDNLIPLKDVLEQSHLPNISYFHVLKASGHMGMWEEESESNRLLQEFLMHP
jgi:pimeloyl-ACP methyl ester carboxylesterase